MSKPKVSLGKWSDIKEKGMQNAPLFLKDDTHDLTLIGKGTWGAKASACIITSKGSIGAYALMKQMELDDCLNSFLQDGEFVFEVGTPLVVTIANKNVVEVRIPSDEKKEEDNTEDLEAEARLLALQQELAKAKAKAGK